MTLTTLGQIPDGACFRAPTIVFIKCQCSFRRIKPDDGLIEVSIEFLCNDCAGHGRNGGWALKWIPDAVIEFDPLAAALRDQFEAQ